jgi:DNA-binding MarR family transcriptional regulator
VHNLVMREGRSRLANHCTMPQFDVLAQLTRSNGGTTLAELSRHLLVTAGNITGIIDRMENAGLVQRVPDPEDRRTTRVKLTPKGRALAETVIPKHAEDIRKLFDSLSASEIAQLRKLLDKLLQGLEG